MGSYQAQFNLMEYQTKNASKNQHKNDFKIKVNHLIYKYTNL